MKTIVHSILLISILGCSSSVSQDVKGSKPVDFNGYWYAGEAEITSYTLEQARYGETHKGTSVLVYVTEPFSKSKQVKLDNWRDQSEDNVSVLKLNMTRKALNYTAQRVNEESKAGTPGAATSTLSPTFFFSPCQLVR